MKILMMGYIWEVYLEQYDLWLKVKLKNIYDQNDHIMGSLLKFKDITRLKKAEDELMLFEHKSRAIIEAIPDMMFILNREGEILDFKYDDKKVLAIPPHRVMGSNIRDIGLGASDLEDIMAKIKNTLDEGCLNLFEYELPVADSVGYFEARFIKLNSSEVLVIVQDISQLKEIQKCLQKSESLYRSIFNNTGVATAIIDKEGYFSLVNEKMEQFLGDDLEELVAKKWMDYGHPYDISLLREYHQICQNTQQIQSYQSRFIDSKGETHLAQITMDKIPDQERYVVSMVDITPLKKAQSKLEESEKKYREIFENVQDVFYQLDSAGRIIDISASIYRYTGYTREELIGENWEFLNIPHREWEKLINTIKEEDEVVNYEIQIKNRNQRKILFSINAQVLRNTDGEIKGVQGSFRDISDYKKMEQELKYQLELETLLVDISKNFINQKAEMVDTAINEALKRIGEFIRADRSYLFQINPEGDQLTTTHKWCQDDSLEDNLEDLKLSDFRWSKNIIKKTGQLYIPSVSDLPPAALKEKSILEYYNIQAMIGVGLKLHGKMRGFIGFDSKQKNTRWSKQNIDLLVVMGEIITNLLEKKYAEEAINHALQEKELLLKEIHHRVKNNMQIISSLLNLQKNYVEEEKLRQVLKESQGRIKTMCMVHEKMYQSESLSKINFTTYLQQLMEDLFYTYGVSSLKIKPVLQIDEVEINIETAIPLGLIVNELLTNSLKYAFPDDIKGRILIKFYQEEGRLNLIVSDNGVGLPDDLIIEETNTLGLKLVKSLAQQLDADLLVNKNNGACFKIVFQELDYEDRL